MLDAEGFRAFARTAVDEFSTRKISETDWATFAESLDYVPLSAGASALEAAVDRAERSLGGESRRLHYLSVPPSAALSAVRLLGEAGLVERSRVVMEKPFGTDLASAVTLKCEATTKCSPKIRSFESTTFSVRSRRRTSSRSALRTAYSSPSGIAISSITCKSTCRRRSVSETVPGFYEATGAFRDMVVTHLFQIVAFMAMEPPTALLPGPISEEKNKVFRSLMPIDPKDVVRGQYIGYRQEDGVDSESENRNLRRAQVHDR